MLNEQEKLDQDIQEKLEKKKQKQKKQEQEMQDVQEHLQPISEERRWAKFEAWGEAGRRACYFLWAA